MIEAENLSVVREGNYLLKNISFRLNQGEHLIITGNSGSGKTMLARVLADKLYAAGSLKLIFPHPRKKIFVEQRRPLKNKSNTTNGYYQQRYNSYDNEDSSTVLETLLKVKSDEHRIHFFATQFSANDILHKPLVQLSSGEHKRFQLIEALLHMAQLLILDEPFIGLDAGSRKKFAVILKEISRHTQLIIIASSHYEYLNAFTHVMELNNGEVIFYGKKEDYAFNSLWSEKTNLDFSKIPLPAHDTQFDIIVKMTDVSVKYAEKVILDKIHWVVKKGERWLISGRNGSGKSTLLSLINGDNPQAYANNIILFDRRRGTGESIWDIKKNIGFMSSELYAYFDKCITCFDVVASGFFDTIGLYKKLNNEQINCVNIWLEALGMKEKAQKRLSTVSQGRQRLLLLARALVKNAPLLILDEPCQGLDSRQTKTFLELIDWIAGNTDKTIIYVSHYEAEIPHCIENKLSLN